VQSSLVEMRDHLLQLAERENNRSPNRHTDSSFREMLAEHLNRYRMASQTITHMAVSGETVSPGYSGPSIELF